MYMLVGIVAVIFSITLLVLGNLRGSTNIIKTWKTIHSFEFWATILVMACLGILIIIG